MTATMIAARPTPAIGAETPVLEVEGLSVQARRGRDRLQLLEDVALTVRPGHCTVVIGESGSGKSTLLKAILRTLGRRVDVTGEVSIDGVKVSGLGRREFSRVRGSQVALVAQNALAALDPLYAVGKQIAYLAQHHGGLSDAAARQRALELLTLVGLHDPEHVFQVLPHELSGGMRQRCVLAMALACRPRLLLADEPTTALDVITQEKALELLLSIQRESGTAMLFVTHDIGVAATVADDVVVLYAGRVVEQGPVSEVLVHPQHPYTRGLVDANIPPEPGQRWKAIGGEPPRPGRSRAGCAFVDRCAERVDACLSERPKPVRFGDSTVYCHARAAGAATGQAVG